MLIAAMNPTPDGKLPGENNCSPREIQIKMAMTQLNLSARACDRILKVARTIADLAGAERTSSNHISEAIHYRSLHRQISP